MQINMYTYIYLVNLFQMKIARSHVPLQLSQILIYLPRRVEADRIIVPVKCFRIAFCLGNFKKNIHPYLGN